MKCKKKSKRVQSFRLWLQYWSARERVAARPLNQNVEAERRWLFHGCRNVTNREQIISNGFDQQRANSCPYGVYFFSFFFFLPLHSNLDNIIFSSRFGLPNKLLTLGPGDIR